MVVMGGEVLFKVCRGRRKAARGNCRLTKLPARMTQVHFGLLVKLNTFDALTTWQKTNPKPVCRIDIFTLVFHICNKQQHT